MERDEHLVDPQEARDLERQDRVEQLEAQERDEDAAEADFDEEVTAEAAQHFEEVAGRTRAIFHGDDVALDSETLSAEERDALAMLVMVVRGDELIDAEQRLERLNEVLAVLAPTLSVALMPELEELRGEYDDLVEEVHALRARLENLDASQEEVAPAVEEEAAGDADQDEPEGEGDKKPDGYMKRHAPKPQVPGTQVPGTQVPGTQVPGTLYGEPDEAAVEKPVVPSTVYDPTDAG